VSEEWWPHDTATPPSDGTHRVVQQGTGGVSLYLRAPADPTAHPFWTPEHNEAGAWPLRDAARLAAQHTGLRDSSGVPVEAWSEVISPDEQD
jgi:hypothetical protein